MNSFDVPDLYPGPYRSKGNGMNDQMTHAEAASKLAELADEIECNRAAIAELVEALKLVEQWLKGWGSAEIYIDMLRAAITKHDSTTKEGN